VNCKPRHNITGHSRRCKAHIVNGPLLPRSRKVVGQHPACDAGALLLADSARGLLIAIARRPRSIN